jgi:hypothetical protein
MAGILCYCFASQEYSKVWKNVPETIGLGSLAYFAMLFSKFKIIIFHGVHTITRRLLLYSMFTSEQIFLLYLQNWEISI